MTLIFAGQLLDVRREGPGWVLRLDPESGFLWANLETWEALGFTFDAWWTREQVAKALQNQATHLELREDTP
jgi:hypothetical protein